MEELQTLAKAVITTALRDVVEMRMSTDFKYIGHPYVDNKSHILWSKIEAKHIDVSLLQWFESKSRVKYSFLYWLGYSGFNPNCIAKYIKKLREILNGARFEDEKEIEIDRCAEPEQKFTATGYLPYVRMHPHSKKWMNV
jgi:hypothetical protein